MQHLWPFPTAPRFPTQQPDWMAERYGEESIIELIEHRLEKLRLTCRVMISEAHQMTLDAQKMRQNAIQMRAQISRSYEESLRQQC